MRILLGPSDITPQVDISMNRKGYSEPKKNPQSIRCIVLIAACLLTLYIQFFALFYSKNAEDIDDAEVMCQPEVFVTFPNDTDSDVSIPTLLDQLNCVESNYGCVLSNRRSTKNYLGIGIPVGSTNGTLILETLKSISNRTSTYEKLHNVVIVMVFDRPDANLVQRIVTRFQKDIQIGFLHILHLPLSSVQSIPLFSCDNDLMNSSLTPGPRPASDTETCFHHRSLLLSLSYLQEVAENYLHLDDNTEVAKHYIEAIREFVRKENKRSYNWSVLEFSHLNFVGKFMRSRDLVKYVNYLATFHDTNSTFVEMFELFLKLMSQKSRIVRNPTLFRRSQVTLSNEDDSYFDVGWKPWRADNPPGAVLTNMQAVEPHFASFVYGSGNGYFRARLPQVNDWITIVFHDDIQLHSVKVKTGHASPAEKDDSEKFSLGGGILEASPKLLQMNVANANVKCADFVKIGDLLHGSMEVDELKKTLWGRPTKCLRLTVTETSISDVIFTQIAVFTNVEPSIPSSMLPQT